MSMDVSFNAKKLNNIISYIVDCQKKELMGRIINTSRSFKKKLTRHILKTPDVAYCSFETKNFVVGESISQRSSRKRIERFGINIDNIKGKTVLDLGCNCGAMLFQLSNYGIKAGLGIEYDADKVDIANEIARLSEISNLEFSQGDLDTMQPDKIGKFEVVLALAIEAHVNDREKLFDFISKVTKEVLYFEGNSRCDVEEVSKILKNIGFKHINYIGFCNDDIREKNNNRPMIAAFK